MRGKIMITPRNNRILFGCTGGGNQQEDYRYGSF
jgi:hypothetical protein